MGVYLTGVYLMGMHLTGVYLTGMHVTGVYLMGIHLRVAWLLQDGSSCKEPSTNALRSNKILKVNA
jgi:hypothetical protein